MKSNIDIKNINVFERFKSFEEKTISLSEGDVEDIDKLKKMIEEFKLKYADKQEYIAHKVADSMERKINIEDEDLNKLFFPLSPQPHGSKAIQNLRSRIARENSTSVSVSRSQSYGGIYHQNATKRSQSPVSQSQYPDISKMPRALEVLQSEYYSMPYRNRPFIDIILLNNMRKDLDEIDRAIEQIHRKNEEKKAEKNRAEKKWVEEEMTEENRIIAEENERAETLRIEEEVKNNLIQLNKQLYILVYAAKMPNDQKSIRKITADVITNLNQMQDEVNKVADYDGNFKYALSVCLATLDIETADRTIYSENLADNLEYIHSTLKQPWVLIDPHRTTMSDIFSAVEPTRIRHETMNEELAKDKMNLLRTRSENRDLKYGVRKKVKTDDSCVVLVVFKKFRGADLTPISQAASEREVAGATKKYKYTRKDDREGVLVYEATPVDSEKSDKQATKKLQKLVNQLLTGDNLTSGKVKVSFDTNNHIQITVGKKQYDLSDLLEKGDIDKLTFKTRYEKQFINYALIQNNHVRFKPSKTGDDIFVYKAKNIEEGKKYFQKNPANPAYIVVGNKLYPVHPDQPDAEIKFNNKQLEILNKKRNPAELDRKDISAINHPELNKAIIKYWEKQYKKQIDDYKTKNDIAEYKSENLSFAYQLAENLYTGSIYLPANMLMKGESQRLLSMKDPTPITSNNKVIDDLRRNPNDMLLVLLTSVFANKAINSASQEYETTMRLERLPGYVINEMDKGNPLPAAITSATYGKSSYVDPEQMIEDARNNEKMKNDIDIARSDLSKYLDEHIKRLNLIVLNVGNEAERKLLGGTILLLAKLKDSMSKDAINLKLADQLQKLKGYKKDAEGIVKGTQPEKRAVIYQAELAKRVEDKAVLDSETLENLTKNGDEILRQLKNYGMQNEFNDYVLKFDNYYKELNEIRRTYNRANRSFK